MKNYQPDYYNNFKCIADKCSITCCQEWKIAVDDATNRKWKKLSADKVSGKSDNLSSYTFHKDGSLVIKLDEKHRCPFLSKDKLCHLVMTYSDEVLSETCALFPREIHRFSTHEERTLMPCCPAVIDLWCEKPVTFPVISETRNNLSTAFLIRDNLIKLISDQGLSVELALLDGLYILLELHKNQPVSNAHIQEYFSNQTLNELNTAMEDIHIPDEDTFIECNELLQDLSVNYRKEGLYTAFLQPVLTEACKYSNIYSQSDNNYMSQSLQTSQKHFCSLLTDYDIVFRNYLANELFSDLISPETASTKKIVEHIIIKMQWIMIEYTAIRQSLFLWYSHNANSPLTYETIREHIVIISRMTGYDDDDIREYLENSFAKLIWDWGYAALIMGIRK
jgi:hypothetical protein